MAEHVKTKTSYRHVCLWSMGIGLFLVGILVGSWVLPNWGPNAHADKEGKATSETIPSGDEKKPDPTSASPSKLDDDPDIALAIQLQQAFKKVSAHVAPSVVSLTVFSGDSDWSEQLWKMHQGMGPKDLEREFTGSGVILRADGTILTNEHVVRDATHIQATLHDNSVFTARVVGTDARSDLAVLCPVKGTRFKNKLVPAVFADSDSVQKGQWAVAVGNPFKLANTMTVGVISARGRSLTNHRFFSDVFYGDLIQTDAATNPGNSGGPLFNIRGELIGINTMIYSRSGKFEGFGFAIPSNQVKPRLAYLEAGRPVEYGWLGVALKNLEPDQRAFPLLAEGAVLVQEVFPDMPADRAGMKRGSVILAFNGQPVHSTDELIMAVGMAQVGKKAVVRLRQPDGDVIDLEVLIGLRTLDIVQLSRDSDVQTKNEAPKEQRPGEMVWRGMRVKELAGEEAKNAGGPLRVISVKKGSPADRAGLYEGAILDEVKYAKEEAITKLDSLSQFQRIAKIAEGAIYLHASVVGYVQLDTEIPE